MLSSHPSLISTTSPPHGAALRTSPHPGSHRGLTRLGGCVTHPPPLQQHRPCKRHVSRGQFVTLFCVTSEPFLAYAKYIWKILLLSKKAHEPVPHVFGISLISVLSVSGSLPSSFQVSWKNSACMFCKIISPRTWTQVTHCYQWKWKLWLK